MNRYGEQAQSHWRRWLPKRYAALGEKPESFFEQLGEEISDEVDALSSALAGNDVPGEGFMGKLGRLNMARFNAEGQILRELALLEPEESEEEEMEEKLETTESEEI
jgi:hypothetical protein